MTFQELREIDLEGAYDDWSSVKDAKYLEEIPIDFAEYFDDNCECGSENIIKRGLTMITCCDPKCPIKVGYALAEMFTRFGIKGIQQATCSKIYSALKQQNDLYVKFGKEPIFPWDSYISVLAVPWEKYPSSISATIKGGEFYAACQRILNTPVTFSQMIANMAISSIGSDAEKLLAGIVSIEDLLAKIKAAGSVRNFCISNGFNSEMIAFNLHHSLTDIAVANVLMRKSIRTEGKLRLQVCMTGAIKHNGVKTTKEKFLNACNELCIDDDNVQLFEIKMTSGIESNPFILFSQPSNDRKYVAGLNRGVITDIYGTHPVLLHVDKFYIFLERVMQRWNERKKKELSPIQLKDLLKEILKEVMSEILEETQEMKAF